MFSFTNLASLRWSLPLGIALVGSASVLTASRYFSAGQPVVPARAEFTNATVQAWQRANTNPWDTIKADSPMLLFDEDFTDGAFDNHGAIINGSLRWNLFGGKARFGQPQNRPEFPLALVRSVAAGGDSWEGAQWHAPKPMLYLDKIDDISIVKWTSFSDVARRAETYGVEVAMLEETSDPQFQGNPHFGHDQSWEGFTMFSNDRASGAMQLEGNVENTNNRQPEGVKRAHFRSNGGYFGFGTNNATPFDSAFGQAFTSVMLWRKDFQRNKANIEQWGHVNYADYNLDTNMVSLAEPNHKFNKFNMVQVTLFRGGVQSGNPLVKRSGITDDSLQVGCTHVLCGITKRADFNIDFKTDSLDGVVLAANMGMMANATLRDGDATNDQKADLNDALPLAAWMPNKVDGGDSVICYGTYDQTTGQISISSRNINFLKIVSTTGQLTGTAPSWASLNPVVWQDSDTMTGLFSNQPLNLTNHSLGQVAASGISTGLYMVVNYAGSPNSSGFVVPFNLSTTVPKKAELAGNRLLEIDGHTFRIPVSGRAQHLQVFDLGGRLLHQSQLPGGTQPQHLGRVTQGHGLRIMQVIDDRQRSIFTQKYLVY